MFWIHHLHRVAKSQWDKNDNQANSLDFHSMSCNSRYKKTLNIRIFFSYKEFKIGIFNL